MLSLQTQVLVNGGEIGTVTKIDCGFCHITTADGSNFVREISKIKATEIVKY